MLKLSGSMSTKTGVPPVLWMVPAVAKNVNGVVMTSSPGFKSSAFRGKSRASVPLAQATPCLAWASAASAASNRGTGGPMRPCRDAAGAEEGVLAEGHAADDRGVGADRAAALHEGRPVLVAARDVAARIEDVREHAGGSAEHVVLEGHALVDRDVVLDLHVVPDPRAGHDDHVLSQIAALADHGTGHDVAEVPDLGAATDARPVVDVARGMDEVVGHLGPDDLHLALGLDARLLGDGLAAVADHPQYAARRGGPRVCVLLGC